MSQSPPPSQCLPTGAVFMKDDVSLFLARIFIHLNIHLSLLDTDGRHKTRKDALAHINRGDNFKEGQIRTSKNKGSVPLKDTDQDILDHFDNLLANIFAFQQTHECCRCVFEALGNVFDNLDVT